MDVQDYDLEPRRDAKNTEKYRNFATEDSESTENTENAEILDADLH